jgi:hypothetical protein
VRVISDDKQKRGEPDRSRVNLSEDYEVQYRTKAIGATKGELERAVEEVERSAGAVGKFREN